MLTHALLLTTQLLLAQSPVRAAESPATSMAEQSLAQARGFRIEPLAPSTEGSERSHLSLIDDATPERPSPAWALARVPLALGAGVLASVASYYAGAILTFLPTVPFGCFTLYGRPMPAACYAIMQFGGFMAIGVGSAAAVAGVGTLLHGEGDIRYSAVVGLLGGIGFATASVLSGGLSGIPENLQWDNFSILHTALLAVPALAVLTYELSSLLAASRSPVRLTATVVPAIGHGALGHGALLAVGGRF
jgi:hypothetical protein